MINSKYAYLTMGVAILILIPSICNADDPGTSSKIGQTVCTPKSTLVGKKTPQVDTVQGKIIGKGVYILEEQNNLHGFFLIGPKFNDNVKPSELLEIVRKRPENEIADDALLFAAEKYFLTNKPDMAIDALNEIIKRYPYSAQVDEGVLFIQRLKLPQNYSQEKDILKSHIRDHPNLTADEALRRKAFYLETFGKRSEAIAFLEEYVEKHPRGRWANENKKVRILVQSLPFRRTDELIYHHLAWLYIQNGDHAKAVNPLKQAIKTFVGSQYVLSYYDLLAKAYRKTGDTKQEIATLLQLQELIRRKGYLVGVEGDDRAKFPPHKHWRYWLRVRPTEKIEHRLAELKGK